MNMPTDRPRAVLFAPNRIAHSIALGPANKEWHYLEEEDGEKAQPKAWTADEA